MFKKWKIDNKDEFDFDLLFSPFEIKFPLMENNE